MAEPRSYSPPTSHSLIIAVKQGDSSAWTRFYDLYGPIVYRFARHARLQDADAEEVVANVMRNFLRWMKGDGEFDPARGKFRHYLRRTVNNEISQMFEPRAVRGRGLGGDSDESGDSRTRATHEASADELWDAIEEQELLRASIEELLASQTIRPRDLLAFQRFALNNEDAKVVARELDLSTARLYVVKHELLKELRKIVKRRLEELGEG
jgi:RNA polymerase sigma-70 factor (ECF subfamily)